jgi:hypothetical protein
VIHRDPVRHRVRRATAADPVPYAGGGISESAAPSTFMHNSFRPVGSTSREVPGKGGLLYITEEQFGPDCAGDGKLVIARGSST